MSAITITLNQIRAHQPCQDGWAKLLRHLGKTKADDEPFPLAVVLDSNGLDDTLWCLRCLPEHDRLWRHFSVDCAEEVAHLLTDERSREALRVARRFADGLATYQELGAARDAALAAARDAAWAADAARAAARAAARDAALAAARDAAWFAARAAARDAALAAAWAAARDADAARAAARAKQTERLRQYLTLGDRP